MEEWTKALEGKIVCNGNTGLRWNFFFKVRVVSYATRYADFGKNTHKILARTVFRQIEIFCMEKVKPGCFIDK